jgi:hypothetical protein
VVATGGMTSADELPVGLAHRRPPLALLPSPLVGPAVWSRVAAVLGERGWQVVLPAPWTKAPRTPADVIESYAAALDGVKGAVAVPHSNAGLYVAPLRARCSLAGVVYTDALVAPSRGIAEIASPEFLAVLAEKADEDGVLPPWSAWWPDEEVAELFPDAESRAAVMAEEQRLPLTYFSATFEVPSGWDVGLPSAYLAFGDTYADYLADARNRDWPVRVMDGQHLHPLVDATAVADALETLVAEIGRA